MDAALSAHAVRNGPALRNDPAQGGWTVRVPGSRESEVLHVAIDDDQNASRRTPDAEHRFDMSGTRLDGCLSLTIAPAPAPDVEAWGDPVELLRAQCVTALDLLSSEMVAVSWAGADSIMGAEYFRRMIGIWIDGGAFPALGLAALVKEQSGVVRSTGLDVLVGQEVAVIPAKDMSPADQARLAMRVMDFLVREGPVQQDQTVEVDGFGMVNMQIDPKEGVINLYR